MTVHCVTPNPAVDVTYSLDELHVHEVNRVTGVTRRPGGKGVNVARLLWARGVDASVYGFLGGRNGELLKELLSEHCPEGGQRWTSTAAETRRTIAVVDNIDTTMLNEPGRRVSNDDWTDLNSTVVRQCAPCDVVTVSGSLPAGSDPEQLAALIRAVREREGVAVVDTSGPALRVAAESGAHVLKPNRAELAELTGMADVRQGITWLLDRGCSAIVASLGSEGLLLGTGDGFVSAKLSRALVGNPTGAGDAVVAALAARLLASPADTPLASTIAEALPQAVAWSAAAVLAPVAGEIDHRIADRLVAEVETKEL